MELEPLPPGINAAFAPTSDIHPGDPITFKVRTFGTTDGEETWDFGDGTPTVQVRSDGNVEKLARDGYAIVTHSFTRPGDYLPHVERHRSERPQGDGAVVRARRACKVIGAE